MDMEELERELVEQRNLTKFEEKADSLLKTMDKIVEIERAHFTKCIEQGFDVETAMYLTSQYLKTVLGG